MALDPVVNFFRSEIATLPLASGTTTMVITTGDGNKLPNPSTDGAFNLTIYNADDPFVTPEIVRCTAKSGDSLTITRAQEGTTATNKTTGSTWYVELTPTAKTIQDIDDKKLDVAGGTMTGDLTIPDKIIHSGDTNTFISFPSADTVTVETNGVERFTIGSTGVTNIFGLLNILSGTSAIIAGADSGATTRTDSTQKLTRIGAPHYTNAEEAATMLIHASEASNNVLSIGGGSSSFNASTIIRFYTASNNTTVTGTERLRINSSGNVGIGTTSPATKLHVNETASNTNVEARLSGTGSYSSILRLFGANSFLVAENNLRFQVGGPERVRIESTGILRPGADNTQTLGSASFRWSEVFAGNGTINTSDATEKQEVAELSEAEHQVATALKGLIRKYRWISSVAEKGDDARIHVGVMAQDVKQAFTDAGLDAERYGVYCKDTWYTKEETYTEQIENPDFDAEHEESETNPRMIDGDEKTRTIYCESDDPDATEHVRYGVRYDQLFAFIISAL
jgi:hypothetical protein